MFSNSNINLSQASKTKQVLALFVWLVICFVASSIGAFASIQAAAFYGELTQPSWAPPSWIFGPVWTILYAMMGVAAWLVWREGGIRAHRSVFILFFAQLTVNALWSWLFFAWHLGAFAFVDIIVLWTLIVLTIATFWRIKPLAGALLIPYLLWVSFAAVLNFSVWHLNPLILG